MRCIARPRSVAKSGSTYHKKTHVKDAHVVAAALSALLRDIPPESGPGGVTTVQPDGWVFRHEVDDFQTAGEHLDRIHPPPACEAAVLARHYAQRSSDLITSAAPEIRAHWRGAPRS